MKSFRIAVFTAAIVLLPAPWSAFAADNEHGGNHTAPASGQTHTGKGVVKWVDAEGGEIDVRHEAIPSLKWPAMTMTFKAHDAALLKGIREKDVVEFDITKMGDEYEIVRIQKTN